MEDVLQIIEINEARAFGHSLINFDDVVNRFYVRVVEQLVDVEISVGKLTLELLVRVLEQVIDVDVLLVWVSFFTDHPADTFVHE